MKMTEPISTFGGFKPVVHALLAFHPEEEPDFARKAQRDSGAHAAAANFRGSK